MLSSHRFVLLSMLLLSICLAMPASADPGPQAYADAKAPLPEKELDRLTRKLESLAAKKKWKKASELASEKLGGEAWCEKGIALPFRTFAALGVVARRAGQKELALSCTLRSFFEADTRVRLGQVYFELSLLVEAMSVEEFIAFRERVYGFKSDGCDQDWECCYLINGFDSVIRSFDSDFYGYGPGDDALSKEPAKVEAQRKTSAKNLLGYAYVHNPSPTLARRLEEGSKHIESVRATLPERLLASHTATSMKSAKAWIRKDMVKGNDGEVSDGYKIELEASKPVSRDELHVVGVMAHMTHEDCWGPEFSSRYLIVYTKDAGAYHVFVDTEAYSDNGCGGYGDIYEVGKPVFQKLEKGEAPLFVAGSSSNEYTNGGTCGATGGGMSREIYCGLDKEKVPRCLQWTRYTPFDMELGEENQPPGAPMFRFKKGRSDFDLAKYSSAVRALLEPLEGVSFMELYEALPGVEAELQQWFVTPKEKVEPAAKPGKKAP